MSEYVRLRFDGSALTNHSIDASELATALAALSDLCKETNLILNHGRTTSQVLVNAEADQHCFELYFDLVLSLVDGAKSFLDPDKTYSGKDILQYLGISGSISTSIFLLIKCFKGRAVPQDAVQSRDEEKVVINVNGSDNVIIVHPKTLETYENPKAMRAAQRLLSPLKKDGYDKLEFEDASGKIQKISKDDVNVFVDSDLADLNREPLIDQERIITTFLRVHSPVYDVRAPKWRFKMGDDPIYVDISDTAIAAETVARGGAFIDDKYEVDLRITPHRTKLGEIKNEYKVVRVLAFFPSARQPDLLQ